MKAKMPALPGCPILGPCSLARGRIATLTGPGLGFENGAFAGQLGFQVTDNLGVSSHLRGFSIAHL